MEEKGMYGFVGKVNMDCNSPEFLIETTEDSLRETEIYLDSHTGSGKVKPILAHIHDYDDDYSMDLAELLPDNLLSKGKILSVKSPESPKKDS